MKLRDYFLHDRFCIAELPPELRTRARLGDPTLLVVAHNTAQAGAAHWWLCDLLDPLESLPDPFSPAYDDHRYRVERLSRIRMARMNSDYEFEANSVLLPWITSRRTRVENGDWVFAAS